MAALPKEWSRSSTASNLASVGREGGREGGRERERERGRERMREKMEGRGGLNDGNQTAYIKKSAAYTVFSLC